MDVIVDVVGGDLMTDSLRSLGTQGRLLVVGFTAGAMKVSMQCAIASMPVAAVRPGGWTSRSPR